MTNGFMVQYVREGLNIPVLVSSKSATLGLMLAIIAVLPAAAPCKKNAKKRREEGCDLGHTLFTEFALAGAALHSRHHHLMVCAQRRVKRVV